MPPSTPRPSELDAALQAITKHKNELVAVVVQLNDTYLVEERRERNLPVFPKIIGRRRS